jgi:hypothetical protein
MSKESLVAEVSQAITLYEKTIGQAAIRTRMIIEDYGEIGALSQLVKRADPPKGFIVLRDAGKLDSTFEAIVVRFSGLFAADVVEAAKSRLKNSHNPLGR